MKRALTALAIVMAACSAGAAQTAATAASTPTAKQLSALCDACAIVGATHTEKRKGKASGVGVAGGAVAGGVVGNKVGDSTVATVGGAVIGGVIGNELEKRYKRRTVWVVTTTARDGSTQRTEFEHDPQLRVGDTVVPDGAIDVMWAPGRRPWLAGPDTRPHPVSLAAVV